VEVVSITVAILLEVTIGLLHPLLSKLVTTLLAAGVAISAVGFVIYVHRIRIPPDGLWQEYQCRREAEFQRHEQALRDS